MSRRGLDLLGVVSPGMATVAEPVGKPPLSKTLVPGVALGVAGIALVPKHPFLAFLSGDALGMNAYRLYRGQDNDRTIALSNIGQTGCLVAGSLAWKEHPFWGGVLGLLAGAVATSFIPGSNAYKFRGQ